MELSLKGKVAMVAAASRGLGFGIADALAKEGANLSIGSRHDKEIFSAARSLSEKYAIKALGVGMDASERDSIERWVQQTTQAFGTVDCLVINAGGPPAGRFDQFGDKDWQAAFELTLMSAVRMLRCVLPLMREKGKGSIVCITSTTIKEPSETLILSNVMRSGLTSLIKTLSFDLAKEGIRINNIVPGRIDTDRVRALDGLGAVNQGISPQEIKARNQSNIPMQRYGNISEFGAAAAFLLSDAASYITGETLVVDGGATRTVW